MEQAKISIIVPIYKVEPYLEQCIRSLTGQTYEDIEIFLVDDGSPDRCGEICDAFAAKDERIRVIHQKNMGVSVARNAGLEAANGEYVMFVDGDDWLEDDCCEKALCVTEEHQCDIVYLQYQEDDVDGNLVKIHSATGNPVIDRDIFRLLQISLVGINKNIYGFNFCTVWAKLYRRKMLVDNDCYFPVGIKRGQDNIFNLYYLECAGNACYLDCVGYHYRSNPKAISHRYNPEIGCIILSFLHEKYRFVQKRHPNEPDFEKALGVGAVRIEREIRELLFFHQDGHLPYKVYLPEMRRYCEDPIVAKYVGKCRLSDFETIRERVRYLLVYKRQYFVYYYIYTAWYGIKSILKIGIEGISKMFDI